MKTFLDRGKREDREKSITNMLTGHLKVFQQLKTITIAMSLNDRGSSLTTANKTINTIKSLLTCTKLRYQFVDFARNRSLSIATQSNINAINAVLKETNGPTTRGNIKGTNFVP